MPIEVPLGPIQGLRQLFRFPAGSKSPFEALPEEGFLTRWIQQGFQSLFKKTPVVLKTGEGAAIKTPSRFGMSTGTKVLVGGGIAATTGITLGGFELIKSPQGQNFITTAGDISKEFRPIVQGGSELLKTLASSPLLLGGLIIIGGVLLLKR